jgi:hypothetical protein
MPATGLLKHQLKLHGVTPDKRLRKNFLWALCKIASPNPVMREAACNRHFLNIFLKKSGNASDNNLLLNT